MLDPRVTVTGGLVPVIRLLHDEALTAMVEARSVGELLAGVVVEAWARREGRSADLTRYALHRGLPHAMLVSATATKATKAAKPKPAAKEPKGSRTKAPKGERRKRSD